MGTYARICSGDRHPDHLFTTTSSKLVLNTMPTTVEERALITDQMTTKLDGDLNPIPSCECGYVSDPLALGIGTTTCPRCSTPISADIAKAIRPVIFFSAPKPVVGLLQPSFISLFISVFNKQSFNTFAYLTDTSYRPVGTAGDAIEALGIPRDYNYFVNNLEEVMCTLATIPPFKTKTSTPDIINLYRAQKADIHCQHLYLMNKSMNIIEVNALSTWMHTVFIKISDIAFTMMGIDLDVRKPQVIINRTAKALYTLAIFYREYFKGVLAGKPGAIRTQMFSSRGSVTQRCVAGSITTNLKHPTEVHLAYTPTLYMLYPQVIGYLFREGYTHRQATAYIHKYTHQYSEKLHRYMMAILELDEGRTKVREFLIQRFPTLGQGSMPLGAATLVKKNARDKTLSFSILGVRSMNLDYDGDELTASPRPPYPEFDRLQMQYNMISTDKIEQISPHLVLSDPVVTNIMHWKSYVDKQSPDQAKQQRVLELFGVGN